MLDGGVGLGDRLAIYRSWLRGLRFDYEIESVPSTP